MRVLAWPLTSGNPYITDLYDRVQAVDSDVTVDRFRPLHAWRETADVVHVHWPGAAVNYPSLARATAKTIAVLTSLTILKQRGAKVVWTCHNLQSHDTRHPRLDRSLRRRFRDLVDGTIHLTEASLEMMADDPVLGPRPAVVVPHGHFADVVADPPSKSDARADLGYNADMPVIGFVGMIREYKNVPALIEAFAAMSEPCRLVIGGRPVDDQIAAEVEAAVQKADAGLTGTEGGSRSVIDLKAHWLTNDEIAALVRAADIVVLPYQEVHNSGVAILALGLARPVAVNPSGSMATLGASVGDNWVYDLELPISGRQLDDVVRWAAKDRGSSPDMSDFDPDEAASRTVQFFRSITA